MNSMDICEYLRTNAYPGRGILIGRSKDGKNSILAYFIMGRTENSRNRVFHETTRGIATKAFDINKLVDPSLVIYDAVVRCNGSTVVSNGMHTNTIVKNLEIGMDFPNMLTEWEYEPDPPIYTPRIAGLLNSDGTYSITLVKSAGGNPLCCCRCYYSYSSAIPGFGHFISTYETDGNPPPSFCGEPMLVGLPAEDDIESFSANIWQSLNESNKVALYVQSTDIESGRSRNVIINMNH